MRPSPLLPDSVRPLRRAILAALVFLAACDGRDPADPGTGPTPVATVTVAPDTATLAPGETRPLGAETRAADGRVLQGRTVAWTSSDEAVARVSATGAVTALAAGEATIAAESEGRRGKARIRVAATQPPQNPVPTLASATPATVAAGGPDRVVTLSGTGFVAGAQVRWNGQARPVTWVSATEMRATLWAGDLAVPGTGELRVANGAPGGGLSGAVPFTVTPQADPVATVELNPAVSHTRVGAPVPLRATLRNAAGQLLTGRHVTWASSTHTVATVDGTGRVTALGAGDVLITATSEGRTARTELTVSPHPISHLVFDGMGGGLYTLDMRLGETTRIWGHGSGVHMADPAPSPNASRIVYTYSMQDSRTLVMFNAMNRTYEFLVTGGRSDQAAWSPVGDRLAFRSQRDGRTDIWTMHADGTTAPVNLTADLPAGSLSERPEWSPDAQRIVFAVRTQTGRTDLWMMNADGTGKRQLTNATLADTEPTWFGSVIVFTRRVAPGESDLWRLNINGGGPVRLTHTGRATTPAWSPEGRWIAFTSRDLSTGEADILAVPPEGGEPRALVRARDLPGGGGQNPAWFQQR